MNVKCELAAEIPRYGNIHYSARRSPAGLPGGLLPQLNVFVNCIYTVREVRIWDVLVLPTSDCHLCSDMDGLTDVTLRRVDKVINQDVEMEAS